ncbi:hypothetical protein [Pseudomonas sp. Pc102]|uniref:hypothetical protein n=1 Tax=Pseudomonas sp. Pc102 TaxID=2678261 RepID=UPI001BCCF6E3|nr:hypothetical protein [Pseudomonas sp. Pc102]
MTVAIIEFRKMIGVSQRYLEGASTLPELYSVAKATVHATHFWGQSQALMDVAMEWEHRINRSWGGDEHIPACLDAQLCEWIRQRLHSSGF